MPANGTKYKLGESCVGVESVKTAADVYSPCVGEVIQSNSALSDPALLTESPEDKAWLIKIKVSDDSNFAKMLNKAAYDEHLKTEAHWKW